MRELRIKSMMIFVGVLIWNNPGWAGGELGNAYVKYENFIGNYSIAYPKNWNYLDLNTSVSFVKSSDVEPIMTSSLSVVEKRFPNITSTGKLLRMIQHEHPNESWTPVKLSGCEGYRSNKGSAGTLYLLREPENVMTLRFQSNAEPTDSDKIEKMIQTLEID